MAMVMCRLVKQSDGEVRYSFVGAKCGIVKLSYGMARSGEAK